MIAYVLIGLLVGAALALTGGGGALLAIPLFMNLIGLSLKTATFMSLIVVIIASLVGFVFTWKKAMIRESFFIFLGTLPGSYLAAYLKESVSTGLITSLLVLVSIIGTYFIWKPFQSRRDHLFKETNKFVVFFIGIILGVLTGLTGLGGGVVLLPLYLSYFQFEHEKAVATSLFTIMLSSLFAFSFQVLDFYQQMIMSQILLMILGVIVGNFLIKLFVSQFNASVVNYLRKITYSIIVFYTLISLYLKETT